METVKHKHYDLIIAWAGGAEIEYYAERTEKWFNADNPAWDLDTEYRVKPTKTNSALWIEEFYPVDAKNVHKAHALEHSIVKWTGLLKENMGDLPYPPIFIDDRSCALCVHYGRSSDGSDDCKECPLAIARNGYNCSTQMPSEKGSPWHKWERDCDPVPMLNELKRTKLLQDRGELVDWSKVAVDTPILVINSDEFPPKWRRHFAKYEGGKVYAYDLGRTSFTDPGTGLVMWSRAKLADSNEDGSDVTS